MEPQTNRRRPAALSLQTRMLYRSPLEITRRWIPARHAFELIAGDAALTGALTDEAAQVLLDWALDETQLSGTLTAIRHI